MAPARRGVSTVGDPRPGGRGGRAVACAGFEARPALRRGCELTVLSKLKTLATMDPAHRDLMAEAAVSLAAARLALLAFPFRKVAQRLGEPAPPEVAAARIAQMPSGQGDDDLANAVGWAVQRMAGYVPFKALCLQQAIAAKMMLRRRGVQSALHFGVAREGTAPLEAHAWLDTAGARVTGYPIRNGFTEIACFL